MIPGETTQGGAEGKQRERKQIHPFDAKAIGEKARRGNHDALRKDIGGGDVGGHMQIRVEGSLNVRQSSGDNRGTHNTDEGPKDRCDKHPPLIEVGPGYV